MIGEEAAFFGQQLGHGEHAGIGFGRCGIVVVDGAIGIENPVVVKPGTLRLRTGFQGLPQALLRGHREVVGDGWRAA